MRILSVVNAIDLKEKMGCVPAWWQLHKALYELGHDLILIPYLGEAVEAPWWRTYDNPCYWESVLYKEVSDLLNINASSNESTEGAVKLLTRFWTKRKWKNKIDDIVANEQPDSTIFFNVPLNQITGIPTSIRRSHGIPVFYFDGDLPTILPEYAEEREFQFNYYRDANLSEYDAFFINSEGSASRIEELGATAVHTSHYAVDPQLYHPRDVRNEYDIAFFGSGMETRKDNFRTIMLEPARELPERKFVIGGSGHDVTLGPITPVGWIPLNQFRDFCSKTKINLNITRKGHRSVYKSSTTRIFELAGIGSCIVSDPYHGLDEWFDVGEELFVAETTEEAVNLYDWLLDDEEKRKEVGNNARKRILSDHTYAHRAAELTEVIERKYL